MCVIAAAEPELPLRAVRTAGREQRFLVLTGHVNQEDPQAARLIVGQQQALSGSSAADQTDARPAPNLRSSVSKRYWPRDLLRTD